MVAWGSRAVSLGERGEVRVWDPSSGQETGAVAGLHTAVLGAVASGDSLLVWSRRRVIEVNRALDVVAKLDTDDDVIGADAGADGFVLRTSMWSAPWGPEGPGERVEGRADWACRIGDGVWTWSAASGLRCNGASGFEAPDATGPPIVSPSWPRDFTRPSASASNPLSGRSSDQRTRASVSGVVAAWSEPFRLRIRDQTGDDVWWHDLHVRPHVVGVDEILVSDAGGNVFAVRRQ